MMLRSLAAALALAAALPSARAADLLTIFRDARVSDPVYQAARQQYAATREKLPQAVAGYLPLVSGTASVFRNEVEREIAADTYATTRTYAVTLSQPVFRVQNWIAITQAEQQLLQSEAVLANAQQDLALRVAQAYFDVLLARDNVALSESQKAAISEQLAQAKRNFEVGTATIVDTLEAQARYDQATAKEISDKNDLQVKIRALEVLIGTLPSGLVPLADPLVLAPPQPNDVEAWVRAATEVSYNIAIARTTYEFLRQEVNRQRAAHLPTLDISGSATRGFDSSLNVQAIGPNTTTYSGGLVLSVPIFSGGLIQSRVREAVANRERAAQDLEGAIRGAAQAVRTNFVAVTSGIAQVVALEQALTSTQSQLESTILGRDVGVRTSVDVLNAQQQVYQTRRDLQQARYNYLLSTLRLKAAAGLLTEDDIALVNRTLAR